MNAAPEVPAMENRKAGEGDGRGRVGGGDLVREIGERLGRAARLAGYEWWWTPTWTAVRDERRGVPLVVALGGLAEVLRSGHDPDVVVGGDSAELAVEVAGEWLGAGVGPGDVGRWLEAGCWRPAAARAMTDAGIRPTQLLRDDGTARHLVDSVSGWPIPLARAVADDEMTVAAAVAYLRGLCDTFRVRVERSGRSWLVVVEDLDEVVEERAPNLAEADVVARRLVARERGDDPDAVVVATDVRLPPPIRTRLDRAEQLRQEGEHPASDRASRQLALDAAAAELRAAARELAALDVTVADVAELLHVTTREAHDLLREPFPRSRRRSAARPATGPTARPPTPRRRRRGEG